MGATEDAAGRRFAAASEEPESTERTQAPDQAHNGKVYTAHPKVKADCGGKSRPNNNRAAH